VAGCGRYSSSNDRQRGTVATTAPTIGPLFADRIFFQGAYRHRTTVFALGRTCSHFQISFLLLGKFGDGKVIVLSPHSPRPALMTKAEFQAVSDGQEKGGKKYFAKATPTLVNSTEKPGDVEATHRASAFGARCQSASRFQPRQQRAADVGCHDPPRAVRMTRSFS
jgi:hypothetical protein